jgi:hypothetical protein
VNASGEKVKGNAEIRRTEGAVSCAVVAEPLLDLVHGRFDAGGDLYHEYPISTP